MRHCIAVESARLVAVALLGGLLIAITAIPVAAQPAREAHPFHPVGVGYDKAHEVTINATINRMVTKHVAGSPAGLHVLVTGPQGLVDTHLGPFMTRQTQSALRAGTAVQIVGAMETVHGKQYLLARELTIGGRTVTVRSSNGMLRVGQSAHQHGMHRNKSRAEVRGGAQ